MCKYFLQIKFSLYNICLELENASGVEAIVSTGIELEWDGALQRDDLVLM